MTTIRSRGDILVFTPTCYNGGSWVTYKTLLNQTVHDNIFWLVADEQYAQKEFFYRAETPNIKKDVFDSSVYRWQGGEALRRTLAHSYDFALHYARTHGFEMMITLQDFIVIAPDAIERLVERARENPNDLISGLCSIARAPSRAAIVDITDPVNIFDYHQPVTWYEPTPYNVAWHDIRYTKRSPYELRHPQEWEANWGVIPNSVLYDLDVGFDVSYDMGVAYENQYYSYKALEHGYQTYVDMTNHALSFPHKTYWPEKEMDDLQHMNQELHLKRTGRIN